MARVEKSGAGRRNDYRRTEKPENVFVCGRDSGTEASDCSGEETDKEDSFYQPGNEKEQRACPSDESGVCDFLTAAAVVTVFMCVTYLQLQANATLLSEEVTSLEAQVDAAILENNADYNGIMTGIDIEHVKDVAINELGMVYASKEQIVTYEENSSDYVRQYTDIPTE